MIAGEIPIQPTTQIVTVLVISGCKYCDLIARRGLGTLGGNGSRVSHTVIKWSTSVASSRRLKREQLRDGVCSQLVKRLKANIRARHVSFELGMIFSQSGTFGRGFVLEMVQP